MKNDGGRNKVIAALGQPRHCHRRIDVVERADAAGDRYNPIADPNAIGYKRPDDHEICLAHFSLEPGDQILEAVIQLGAATHGMRFVTVAGVPGRASLQKQDVMSARSQAADQAAIRGGVAISPRRRHRKAKDDDVRQIVHFAIPRTARP